MASTEKLSSSAIKAIGERLVSNELTFRGWTVINANAGEQNAPNIDLIALNKKNRITIQVKCSTAKSHKDQHFFGYSGSKGKLFNTKDGPEADFIVSIYVHSPCQYSCLVLPTKTAERACQKHREYWQDNPKRDGGKRSENFPIFLNLKKDDSLEKYADAWELIGKKLR